MFKMITISCFAATILAVIVHFIVTRGVKGEAKVKTSRPGILALLEILKKLACVVGVLSLVTLVVTGFYPRVVTGKAISGYLMMVHATAGPVFAVCLAYLAIMWANRNRFKKSDWPLVAKLFGQSTTEVQCPAGAFSLCRKICFWAILILALPLILSIVLSMLPLFGTCGQEFLLQLHLHIALVVAMISFFYIYLTIRA